MKINYLLTISIISLLMMSCREEKKSDFSGTEIAEIVSSNETKFPSYNANYPPPSNAPEVFELSQDYPKTLKEENYPWLKIDFKKNPEEYMKAVLQYSLEGNIEVNFKGQDNKIRKWFHAPWLHDDGRYAPTGEYIGNGREYTHGLTRERSTPKFEIHTLQDVELESWAVGMYNAPGGYAIGQVWNSPAANPNPEKANFPEGTVSCKLLFTDGTVDKVPFLKNTLEWTANIYPCNPTASSCTNKKRINRTVRLLQIDISIKDKRATDTGWVFGTFMYDASNPGKTVWERMVPVGLSWGDDVKVTTDLNKDGAFINKDIKESYINASLIEIKDKQYKDEAYMRYHGLGGRLNGPVDNPVSSCISCHGQAGVNAKGVPMAMGDFSKKRTNYPMSSFNLYFTNVKPGSYKRTFNGADYTTLDYSLQLSAGIRNYYNNEILKTQLIADSKSNNKGLETYTVQNVKEISKKIEPLPEVTRGE